MATDTYRMHQVNWTTQNGGASLPLAGGNLAQSAQMGGLSGSPLASAIKSGEAHINNSVSAAQGGIGIAGAASGAMRADAGRMRGQAALVNTQGNAVLRDADALAALVPQFDPYREKLGGYGDDLAALGQSLAEQSKDVFGQGGALVNLDPTKGGLSSEFIRQYGYLSPDRYVSRAASDAQAAFDNALAQQDRNLSRRGVSLGSGAANSLMQQLNQAKAAAIAAAKTTGRQQGIDEQTKMLSTMTNAANTLYNMGNQTASEALAAKGAAGDMQKGAAGVLSAQGGMIGDVAKLREGAAGLFANAASIFGSTAGIEGNAASLDLSALKNLQSALQAASAYYLDSARVGISADSINRGGSPGSSGSSYKIDINGNAVPA